MSKEIIRKLYNTLKDSKIDDDLPKTFKRFYKTLTKGGYYSSCENGKGISLYIYFHRGIDDGYTIVRFETSNGVKYIFDSYEIYQKRVGLEFHRENFKSGDEYIGEIIKCIEYLIKSKGTIKDE